MLHNQSRDTARISVCSKAAIGYERHRLQPELGHGPLPLHGCAWRFPAVGAEENETVRSLTKYGRHRAALLAHMFLYSEERFYAEKKKVATEAERRASAAPGSGSAADAGGRRLDALVRCWFALQVRLHSLTTRAYGAVPWRDALPAHTSPLPPRPGAAPAPDPVQSNH